MTTQAPTLLETQQRLERLERRVSLQFVVLFVVTCGLGVSLAMLGNSYSLHLQTHVSRSAAPH